MSSQTSPAKFGRYLLIGEVGRGGMATVYLARDPRFGREVAIKVLPHAMLHDPSFRARFDREARIIAALEHPAIVPVYDYGEEDGQPFFVMRYMPGGSLEARILRGPVPLHTTAQVLSRLAYALDEAHARGIIHRDLKPANILFDSHGEAYLSDFGIVKLKESTTTLTGGMILGTPAYMSPEQGKGQPVDLRTDVYSIGAILFQMLAGRLPYEAETPTGQIMCHISEPVPNVRALRPDLPEAVGLVIEKAMAKNRDDRYSTAGQLANAFSVAIPSVDSSLETLYSTVPETEVKPLDPDRSPGMTSHTGASTHRTEMEVVTPFIAGRKANKEPRPISARMIILLVGAFVIFTCLFGSAGAYLGYRNFVSDRATKTASFQASSQPQATTQPAPIANFDNQTPTRDETAQAALGALYASQTAFAAAPSDTPAPTFTFTKLATLTTEPTQISPPPNTKTYTPLPGPLLTLTTDSFCRGGPGTDWDQIWTFNTGDILDVVGRDGNWVLISFSDPGTRHDRCWIALSNGSLNVDPASLPYSDYRTNK